MSQMTLFRGYSIPFGEEDRFFREIKQHGIRPYSKSRLTPTKPRPLRANTREELFKKENLTTEDTRPEGAREEEYVFACGDYLGAAYYAKCHNKIPDSNAFVIQFTVNSINRVSVDGRDFFCTLVQRGRSAERFSALETCYGKSIRRYLDKAWNSDQQDFRIAMCDLAAEDPKIIRAHLASKKVIRGRFRTIFRSAFVIACPVVPADIAAVSEVKQLFLPDHDFCLKNLGKPT